MAKILLVDDDKTFLAVLFDWFEGRGFKVATRTNGPDAIAFLEKEHIDVVILDFMMQPMTGLELLRHIKENPKTKDIPVFMLSQFGEGRHIEEAMKLGVEDYLVKANFNLESLTMRIKKIISKRK
ncbi:MAG: response regulator [bacterium]|nr:response regulator [bacterium]